MFLNVKNNKYPITDNKMTHLVLLDEVLIAIKALEFSIGGEIFYLNSKVIRYLI